MSAPRRMTIAAAAVTAALMLSGCTSAVEPSASGTPASTATATATATDASPIPSPTASQLADPGDPTTWIVTEQGIGPISLGMSFAEAQAELPAWTTSDQCAWAGFWNASALSQTGYFAKDPGADGDEVTTIEVAALDDSVAPAEGPRTSEGIGLGSTREEVLATYPEAAVQKPTIGDGDLIRLGTQGAGAIYFAIRDTAAKVSAITVTARNEPPYEVCG